MVLEALEQFGAITFQDAGQPHKKRNQAGVHVSIFGSHERALNAQIVNIFT